MFENIFTKIWYGKTLSCRTSLKCGTAAAVPAVPAAPPMLTLKNFKTLLTDSKFLTVTIVVKPSRKKKLIYITHGSMHNVSVVLVL